MVFMKQCSSSRAAGWRPGLAIATLALSVWLGLTDAAAQAGACQGLGKQAVLERVNALREAGALCGNLGHFVPAAPLEWNADLEAAALTQARWLAQAGRLMHLGPQGETLSQRATAAGYRFRRVTENLALGQRDVPKVLSDWTRSDTHCANLYDSRVTEMGLVCVRATDGRPVWVLVMGRPL